MGSNETPSSPQSRTIQGHRKKQCKNLHARHLGTSHLSLGLSAFLRGPYQGSILHGPPLGRRWPRLGAACP